MNTPKKAVVAVGIVVGLLLAVAGALAFLLDVNQFRPLLESQLRERLNRPVSLGAMDLKMFPLAIRVADVSIGQPEGFPSPQPFLQAKEVFVGVAFLPLLRKQVSVDAIRLQAPRIELIRNSSGVWNYETAARGQGSGAATSLTLNELQIADGQVALDDRKAAAARDVYEHIDATLKGLGANRRGSLSGSVRLDTMAAVLKIQSDFDLAGAPAAKGTLSLISDRNKDPLNVDFDVRRPAHGPLVINSLTARIGALLATVAGSVDIAKTPAALQLHAQTANAAIGDLTRIAALYGAEFPAGLKVDGILRADVQVTGTTEKPLLAGKIEATKAQITAKDLAEPVQASELSIELTPDVLTTRPFTLETGATRLTAQATVNNYASTSRTVQASLAASGARVEELLRMASVYGLKPAGLSGTGIVNIDLKVSAAGKAFRYSGSGSLRDVSLTSPKLPKTLSVATADLKFAEDRIGLEHLQLALGSMHLDGDLSVRDFSQPDLQFNAHIDQLNVAELQKDWGGQEAKKDSSPAPITKITANGTLSVDQIIDRKITLTSVKTTIKLAKGILVLDPLSATVFGGQQSGSLTADLRGTAVTYAIKSKLTNVDANQLLSATSSLKGVLSGALSGNADLQFTSKPNEDIARSLNGKLSLLMGQGRLSGVPVLNEIANIGRFFGYAKKQDGGTNISKMSGSLNIQNGLATTNDLFMDMGEGTLSGTGNINLVDQTLKLHVTTILGKDFALKSAPGQIGGLLTTVLANQKNELVVPALVSGTFAQPKFTPDTEQFTNMKLRGLLPTAGNPGALTTGIKGLVDSFTGKQADTKSADAKSGEAKAADPVQDGLNNLFDQFRKKKGEKK